MKYQVLVFLQFREMDNKLIFIIVVDLLVVTFSSIGGTSTDQFINVVPKIIFITYCSHINKYQLFCVRKKVLSKLIPIKKTPLRLDVLQFLFLLVELNQSVG